AGARIEVKHERGRRVPFPALGQQRLEVFVADRVSRRPEIGELEEELLCHVPRARELAHRREQDVRLSRGGDDERAAVVARAAALAGAPSDEQQTRQRGGGGQPGGRSGGRHGALRFHWLVSDARSRRSRETGRWRPVEGGAGRWWR